MPAESSVTVAEIAASSLPAVGSFERLGIDCCYGGKRPQGEVCQEGDSDADAVPRDLDAAGSTSESIDQDWKTAPLRHLLDHIVGAHHEYLKREFSRCQAGSIRCTASTMSVMGRPSLDCRMYTPGAIPN
jgi:iron-sulfur cluster repair protein YtfE (RIC family)